MAYLLDTSDNYTHRFTYMELYGGAHLVYPGSRNRIIVPTIVGDDTAYLHIGPEQTVTLTEVISLNRNQM